VLNFIYYPVSAIMWFWHKAFGYVFGDPSCSAYAVEALQVHGLLRGTALTVWRLLRCAPWHPGGVDPVPPAHTPRTSSPDGSRADPRSRPAENHEEQAPC
jgi:uncharacterized protein